MCRGWARSDSISQMWFPMASGLRIAVTGAAGSIGSNLVARLAASGDVNTIVALDVRPIDSSSPKVHSYQRDILHPIDDVLKEHGVNSLIHLAFQLKPDRNREAARRINVGGTARVLQSCQFADVSHVVYLSSSTIYGAYASNDELFTEESPARPVRGFQYAEDKAATELLMQAYATDYPGTRVTVLRGCVVMGPNSDNFITQAFSKPLLARIRGADPQMQFIHEDDLLDVMQHCLNEPFSDVFNVAGAGTVPYSHIAQVAGRRAVPLPTSILYPLTQTSWTLRLQSDSPACGLDMIRWPWLADIGKLQRETGWVPKYTSQQALEASTLAKKPANNT